MTSVMCSFLFKTENSCIFVEKYQENMTDFTNRVISIYTEQTPNPENIKFVVNHMLYAHNSVDFPNEESVDGASPFADMLFKHPMVRSVFIANNFVTIGKIAEAEWIEIIPEIKTQIKDYLGSAGLAVVDEKILSARTAAEEIAETEAASSEDEVEMVVKIKEMLQKYVQPAVEMDGGSIVFKSYDDGIVTLGMQGACSGCPSSTITLKAGIEGMMKRMIPEVKEVVAEAM